MFRIVQAYRKPFVGFCAIVLGAVLILGAKYPAVNYQPALHGLPRALDPDDWQTVIPGRVFVYSAHLDPPSTNGSTVRVLGAVARDELVHGTRRMYCKIWLVGGEGQTPVVYTVNSSPPQRLEHVMKYEYVAAQYVCRTSVLLSSVTDTTVQLTDNLEADPSNTMFLHPRSDHRRRLNFTVCLGRPLFGDISRQWFLEWMEANLLFGADQVLIHNLSMPRLLDPYVDFYRRTGLLRVEQWHYVVGDAQTHCNLQLTMMHDCLYRLRTYARYAVFVDLDELIVPRSPAARTWSDMIRRTRCVDPDAYGARQLFFNRRLGRVGGTGLMTQDVRMRDAEPTRYGKRSKYIADVTRVTALAVHFPLKRVTKNTCVLPVELGALHHYRIGRTSLQVVQDDTMLKYRDELTSRIKHAKNEIRKYSAQ